MTLNKKGKISFVNQYSESIKAIISEGYDSEEAKVIEMLLKTRYAYKKDANRRALLSSFIKVFCELENPGYVVVGAGQFSQPSPDMSFRFALSEEVSKHMDLVDQRIRDFIEHKDHYMNKYPQNK